MYQSVEKVSVDEKFRDALIEWIPYNASNGICTEPNGSFSVLMENCFVQK